ncbi:hypothetical protein [Streptomyces sp. NPDC097610]|uniref:hypothetical protein n=1 Tax=Streptomyces sp. NPDC097610 TaxID=3157227 RepID=UPI003320F9E6
MLRFRLWSKLAAALGGLGGEELGHGAFGEVVEVEDLPFVVKLGQDNGGGPVEGGRV